MYSLALVTKWRVDIPMYAIFTSRVGLSHQNVESGHGVAESFTNGWYA